LSREQALGIFGEMLDGNGHRGHRVGESGGGRASGELQEAGSDGDAAGVRKFDSGEVD
jgi:hypothetical protein